MVICIDDLVTSLYNKENRNQNFLTWGHIAITAEMLPSSLLPGLHLTVYKGTSDQVRQLV